eukprot:scaffold2237_cov175-Ochromonas_danica.AAC.22
MQKAIKLLSCKFDKALRLDVPVSGGLTPPVSDSEYSRESYYDQITEGAYEMIPDYTPDPAQYGSEVIIIPMQPSPMNTTSTASWVSPLSHYNKKPDFHLTYSLFVKTLPRDELALYLKAGADDEDDSEEAGRVVKGKRPIGYPLRPLIPFVQAILEGKFSKSRNIKLSKGLIGILLSYLVHLEAQGHPHPIGIIYNEREFVFVELRESTIVQMLRCPWV